MREFQGNRVGNDDVIRVLERHRARHLFRLRHLNFICEILVKIAIS